MKVVLKVVCDVDWCEEDLGVPKAGDLLESLICECVEEAIMDALDRQKANGFNHDMDDVLSILPDYAEAKIVR